MNISKVVVNGMNLYCYCNNNPVNDIDGSGYLVGALIALLVGAVVGAVVSVVGTFVGDVIGNISNFGFDFSSWQFSKWQT